jgi:hypothetical protein
VLPLQRYPMALLHLIKSRRHNHRTFRIPAINIYASSNLAQLLVFG